jgi:hypothetical protein
VFAREEHRACHVRNDLVVGVGEVTCLAQLEQRAGGVARLEQGLAEHVAGGRRLGVALQERLQLDRGGLVFLLRHEGLRRLEEFVLRVATATREQRRGQDQGSNGKRTMGDAHGKGP